MSGDYLVVGAVIFGLLSFPSLLSAFTDGRAPRMAIVFIVISGLMLIGAFKQQPQGYTLNEVPDVFIRVIGKMRN